VPALARHMVFRDTSEPERAPSPALRLHPFVHRFAGETSHQNSMQKPLAVVNKANEGVKRNMQNLSAAAVTNRANNAAERRRNDGRIHSYPHPKNGPYTCPKCKRIYATSQLFAAHVSSIHYKFESKSEKRKRLAARYCKRNPRLELVNGKPTIVWGNKKKGIIAPPPSFYPAPHPPVRVVVKSECVQELPPPPGFQKLIPAPPGFPKPIAPLGFQNPIPPFAIPLLFQKPIPALGFRTPTPTLGFGTPIPPPPGFQNMNSVPGFPLPLGFQRSTVAAPRGVQIKQEIE